MALGPDYMSPEMYMGFYRNMIVTQANGSVVQVDIRKYLNHGHVVPSPKDPKEKRAQPKGTLQTRATAANDEFWRILGLVAADPLRDSPEGKARKVSPFQVPLTFTVKGMMFNRRAVHRVFMGKGSSIEVARALWLASHYKRVISTADYCDNYLGLDCNGFASNYWGIAKPEDFPVGGFDTNRRKDITKLQIGDALVYYEGPQSKQQKPNSQRAAHIAVLNEVTSVVKSASDCTIEMNIVQSAGNDVGVHKTETKRFDFKQTADGEFYYLTDSGRTGYLCGGPAKSRPNGF